MNESRLRNDIGLFALGGGFIDFLYCIYNLVRLVCRNCSFSLVCPQLAIKKTVVM